MRVLEAILAFVALAIFLAAVFYNPLRQALRESGSTNTALDAALGRFGFTKVASKGGLLTTQFQQNYEGVYRGRPMKFTLAVSFFRLLPGLTRPGGSFLVERFSKYVEGDRQQHAIANRFECEIGAVSNAALQLMDRQLVEHPGGETAPSLGHRYHIEQRFAECSTGDAALDSAFMLRAGDPTRAQAVLADANVRATLTQLRSIHLVVDGTAIELDDVWTPESRRQVPDWASYEARLQSILNLLTYIADAVETNRP
jgi:hypothetical protein